MFTHGELFRYKHLCLMSLLLNTLRYNSLSSVNYEIIELEVISVVEIIHPTKHVGWIIHKFFMNSLMEQNLKDITECLALWGSCYISA